MRAVILSIIFYFANALQPAPPIPTQAASVVAASKSLKGTARPIGKRRHRRKRIKRIVYAKPPVVYVMPDCVMPITWDEYWRGVEAVRAVAWVRWF